MRTPIPAARLSSPFFRLNNPHDHLLSGQVNLIVTVVDTHILRLTVELLEMALPVSVVRNIMAGPPRRGLRINGFEIAQRLGCPVAALVAVEHEAVMAPKTEIDGPVRQSRRSARPVLCPDRIQASIERLRAMIRRPVPDG